MLCLILGLLRDALLVFGAQPLLQLARNGVMLRDETSRFRSALHLHTTSQHITHARARATQIGLMDIESSGRR